MSNSGGPGEAQYSFVARTAEGFEEAMLPEADSVVPLCITFHTRGMVSFMKFNVIGTLMLALLFSSTACTFKKKEVRTVQLGDKAEIGPFIYRAFETQWPVSLGTRNASDRFFILRVSILNAGSADTTIPSFELVDDQGNTYTELNDGTGVDHWLGLTRKVGVAQTEQGSIIFDVAPKHYRLRVADENDNFMYIDIPLNLNSEEPAGKKIFETPTTQK